MDPIVEVRGLTVAESPLTFLSDITFSVTPGECFGIYGRKGSGKSKLLKVLAGQNIHFSGEVFVGGLNVHQSPLQVRQIVGYVPEEKQLDPDFSPLDNLYIYARLFGISPKQARKSILQMIRDLQVEEFSCHDVKSLSLSVRERFLLVRSLITQPSVVVIDEPLVRSRNVNKEWCREFISYCKSRGISVVFASDNLDFVTSGASRILALRDGQVMLQGEPQSLLEEHIGKEVVEFYISPGDEYYYIQKIKGKYNYQMLGDCLKVYIQAGQDSRSLLKVISSQKVAIRSVEFKDVYEWGLKSKGVHDANDFIV